MAGQCSPADAPTPGVNRTTAEPTGHYRGAAGRQYHEGKRGIPDLAYDWVARARAAKLAPHIRSTDVVVEYGVGSGWNLAALNCRRRVGFDVADFLEPRVKARGIEFVSDWGGLEDGLADVVVCHHTLEHVADPAATLERMGRVLRVGGTLLLYVPWETGRRYHRFDPAEPNHHLFSWNVQTLGNLVTACGWTVRSAGLGRFGYDRFAAAWSARLGLGESGFGGIRWVGQVMRPLREVRVVATR